MFNKGDAVIHPTRGAGIVVGFRKFKRDGGTKRYYQITLLGDEDTKLMVPVEESEVGLRRPVSKSRMRHVWRLLRADPQTLSNDYKKRQKATEAKLSSGDILQITEVVRDMTWRQHEKNDLTQRGKEILDKSIALLTGEIAAALGVDLAIAMEQISTRLHANLPPEPV